ncbi:hypothetical protein, partial [Staphylococcus aureus]
QRFFSFLPLGRFLFIDLYSKSQISQECHRLNRLRQDNKRKCHKTVTFEKPGKFPRFFKT